MAERGHLGISDQGFLGIFAVTLTADDGVRLGRAFAENLLGPAGIRKGSARIAVAYDTRPGSWELQNAIVRGLASQGVHVIHLGHAPTALALFSVNQLRLSGAVVIGGGHRPSHWNGVRFYRESTPLSVDEIGDLRRRAHEMPSRDLLPFSGEVSYLNMAPDYLRLAEREFESTRRVLRPRPIRVVAVTFGGAASSLAAQALRRIGCRVDRMDGDLRRGDGARGCDPSDGPLLRELGAAVRRAGADLGFALDGGGARLRVVDGEGVPLTTDFPAALFLESMEPADGRETLVADVRSGGLVEAPARRRNARLVWSAPGEKALTESLHGVGARFAAGADGLYLFADRSSGHPDGTYAALRLIEILARAREKGGPDIGVRDLLPGAERFRAPEKIVTGIGNRMIIHHFGRLIAAASGACPVRAVEAIPGVAIRATLDGACVLFYKDPADGDLHLRYEAETEAAFHAAGTLARETLALARLEETAAPV